MKKTLKKMIDENKEALERNELLLGFINRKLIANPTEQYYLKSKAQLEQSIKGSKELLEYLKEQ